jgi:hypothetical protein
MATKHVRCLSLIRALTARDDSVTAPPARRGATHGNQATHRNGPAAQRNRRFS